VGVIPAEVSAAVVTRGDVPLEDILSSLAGFGEIVVWDNSQGTDLGVYGRYQGVAQARFPVVYVQDDDCLIDAAAVVAAYEPGRLVANMPQSRWPDYPDSTLVGWGAVFDRDLPQRAFDLYRQHHPDGWAFQRCADVIFSALTPRTVIDVGFQHLPWAERPGRMFKEPDHKPVRDLMLGRCRRIRDQDDDRRIAA
jgi:hypothetical protein